MGHKTGDITTRLRDQALLAVVLSHPSGDVMMDAVKHIETLRKAGDDLVAAIRNHDLTEQHLKAWDDARHG